MIIINLAIILIVFYLIYRLEILKLNGDKLSKDEIKSKIGSIYFGMAILTGIFFYISVIIIT